MNTILNGATTPEELLEKQRYVLSQLNIKVIIHGNNEDGSVDFEITGILPKDTENDLEKILMEIGTNSVYPTTEQTLA